MQNTNRKWWSGNPHPSSALPRQSFLSNPSVVDELTKIALKCTKTSDFELQKWKKFLGRGTAHTPALRRLDTRTFSAQYAPSACGARNAIFLFPKSTGYSTELLGNTCNANLCKFIQIYCVNLCNYAYFIGEKTCPGDLITSDLSPSVHIDNIVAKAHQRANAILRCFVSRDAALLTSNQSIHSVC